MSNSGVLFTNNGKCHILILFGASAGGSPLTTVGDIFGYDGVDARIPVGADLTVLTANSAQALGVEWVAPLAPTGTYTPTNVTPDRSYDANSTSVNELADVLGTLIADLQLRGVLG